MRVLQPKIRHSGPGQRLHRPSAAESLSDIVTERSDISAPGTPDPHGNSRQIHLQDLDPVNGYLSWFPFHLDAPAGQVTEFLTVDLQRRVHGRNLGNLSCIASDHFLYLILRNRDIPGRQHRSRHVLGIRLYTEQQRRLILLVLVCQKIADLCGPSDADRENAHRVRIQRSRMSDFSDLQNTAKPGNHVKGCISHLLIYVDDSASVSHISRLPPCRRHLSQPPPQAVQPGHRHPE